MRKNTFYRIMIAVLLFCSVAPLDALSEGLTPPTIEISRLDFEKADIRQVMKTLAEIGKVNIILDQAVNAMVTIYLRDITWTDAFFAVIKMNDLIAYEDNGLIKVLRRADFEGQQKAMREEHRLQQIQMRQDSPVEVKVMRIHNARAEQVKATLDPLLGQNDRPSVDRRTNSLVFTVNDSSYAVIKSLVDQLDTETAQVSIGVRMVTVDATAMTELGVNWSAIRGGLSIDQTTISEDKQLLATYAGTVSNFALETVIAGLVDRNKAEIISNIGVTTQDNEQATFSSGQRIPILTYDQARNPVIELVDAATQLIVTPHILSENRILMEVQAERKSAEGVGVGLRINEELAAVKLITTDGETAVIGGMRQSQESRQESGVPVLQNIPLFGQLFKYTKREVKKTDLVIFITPRIIRSPVQAVGE